MNDTNGVAGERLERRLDSGADALQSGEEMQVSIENIGGIAHADRTLTPGITPLVGENATNRTSFLTALMAGLGSERDDLVSVNTETERDEGTIELHVDDNTFTRVVSTDETGRTVMTGNPLVKESDTAELLDLYAFLHGENEVRETVESSGDLYDVLMRPVDTDKIEREKSNRKKRREDLEQQLAEIEEAEDEILGVERKIERKQEQRETLCKERDEIQDRIQSLEDDLSSVRKQERSETSEQLEDLEESRRKIKASIADLEDDKARQTSRLNRFEQARKRQLEELQSLLDDAEEVLRDGREDSTELEEAPSGSNDPDSRAGKYHSHLDTLVTSLRGEVETRKQKQREVGREKRQIQQFRANVDDLIDVAEQAADEEIKLQTFAEETLSDDVLDGPITITGGTSEPENDRENSNTHPTDELTEPDGYSGGGSGQCPVCGQPTEEGMINDVTRQYQSIRTELTDEIHRLDDRIDSLEDDITTEERRIDRIRDLKEGLDSVRGELAGLDGKIEDEREKLETYRERIDEKREELEGIETRLNEIALEGDAGVGSGSNERKQEIESLQEQISACNEQLGEKKSEINNVEAELETLESECDELRSRIDRKERIETELEQVERELDDLLGIVSEKEHALTERFNDHMELVVDRLGFSNVERVWIEHIESTARNGTSLDKTGRFELHIVRKRESGATYECKLQHLSESERTVIGLILALTGYLVHDVADVCPVVVLDSIEMIDAERVTAFLSVLEDLVESRWNLVALLPEYVTDSTDVLAEDVQEFTSQGEVTIR